MYSMYLSFNIFSVCMYQYMHGCMSCMYARAGYIWSIYVLYVCMHVCAVSSYTNVELF